MADELVGFSPEVIEKLKAYVYRLIDPRNGETFYVGKGQGNRVFAHIREQVDEEDPSNKLKRIRDIHLAGFEVQHVIHRHGMDDRTAFEVEAALMDAYPGLTNMASGLGNADFGAMHALEIVRKYAAEPRCSRTRRSSSTSAGRRPRAPCTRRRAMPGRSASRKRGKQMSFWQSRKG